jgi:hypothetical protein
MSFSSPASFFGGMGSSDMIQVSFASHFRHFVLFVFKLYS